MPFDLAGKRARLTELEKLVNDSNLWSNPERAAQLTRELGRLRDELERWERLHQRLQTISELAELAQESDDEGLTPELQAELRQAEREFRELEISALLSGEHDRSNAILSITPGAGGTDAQDWAEMLARMYRRWAERHGFDFEVLDYTEGKGSGHQKFHGVGQGRIRLRLAQNRTGRPSLGAHLPL